jgi:hypothetical protein
MDTVFAACAGLDVHKRTVVACRLVGSSAETRTFGTTTGDLLALADWLGSHGCTHVAMEATGVYWKPCCRMHLIRPKPQNDAGG